MRARSGWGRLLTLELSHEYAQVARRNIAHAGLERVVEVRIGPATEYIETTDRGVACAVDKASYADYLEASLQLSRVGALIIADNVVRKGVIIDAQSKDANISGMRRFFEALRNESRISATAKQTVGSRGYDGFAIALATSA